MGVTQNGAVLLVNTKEAVLDYGSRMRVVKPRRSWIQTFFVSLPGQKRFKEYSTLPYFFLFGALLEYWKVNWVSGKDGANFYKTYLEKQPVKWAESDIEWEQSLETFLQEEGDKCSPRTRAALTKALDVMKSKSQ